MAAAIFIAGNVVMPQFFHMLPQGGVTWLPIYFFTLVGAYVYGWRVGLLTAVVSPLVNSLAFGMPLAASLPAIMLKSVMLAGIAGYTAYKFNKVTFVLLMAVVLGYQIVGTAAEWLIKGSLFEACQDFRIGIPGMFLQIIGGYLIIRIVAAGNKS